MTTTATTSTSSSSPPPQQSPTHSLDASDSPTLERLVSHFVAAKRSLSATSHVYRANDIVGTARHLVEEAAVLGAKNAFLKRGIHEEANALGAVKAGLRSVGKDAHKDFNAVVESLDIAHNRLQVTIRRLQETIVDTSLGSRQPAPQPDDHTSPSSSIHGAERTLHDFIAESAHHDLQQSLRQDIDSYHAAQDALLDTLGGFDQSMLLLDDALKKVDQAASPTTQGEADDASASIPALFQDLTAHASETAVLLQSLISHHDLCATALKHTEGGGEAARAAADPASDQDAAAMVKSLYDANRSLDPISAEDKAEMLHVIDSDAQEVDDVVLEIRQRLAEMEHYLSQLDTHAHSARTCHNYIAKALANLRTIGRHLPKYIAAAKTFTGTWSQIREDMEQKMTELASLTDFYDQFLQSYALLLKELHRRTAAEAKMKKVLEKAKREVDAMYDDDLELRDQFVKDVGDFLPRDIWPGLVEPPKRWDFTTVAQPDLNNEGETR